MKKHMKLTSSQMSNRSVQGAREILLPILQRSAFVHFSRSGEIDGELDAQCQGRGRPDPAYKTKVQQAERARMPILVVLMPDHTQDFSNSSGDFYNPWEAKKQ